MHKFAPLQSCSEVTTAAHSDKLSRLDKKGNAMLTIISTPIGNLGDITYRAVQMLEAADIIACEDTRQTRKLLSLAAIQTSAQLWAYHDHNGATMRPKLIAALLSGKTIALVSDAGTPLISDPGYKLVAACHEHNISVTAAPGPSAPVVALTLSGLPSDRFTFNGFVPQKQKAARAALGESRSSRLTQIWFETPKRLAATLKMMAELYGDRQCVVARELTKLHETLHRGSLAELAASFSMGDAPKGELVLVVEGAEKDSHQMSLDDVRAQLKVLLQTTSVRDAVQEVELLSGLPRKQIYQLALEIHKGK